MLCSHTGLQTWHHTHMHKGMALHKQYICVYIYGVYLQNTVVHLHSLIPNPSPSCTRSPHAAPLRVPFLTRCHLVWEVPWALQVSCPGFVPSQLLVPPSASLAAQGEKLRNGTILGSVQHCSASAEPPLCHQHWFSEAKTHWTH